MEQDHWQRIQDLFWRLRSLDGAERERALLAECHDDDTLRADLRSLLDADCSSGILDVGEPILAPLHEVLRETAPQQVGPYIIAAEIGRGGMGVVYRAHDPRLQRDVALKFLPPGLHLHATARARFIAEARAASALDHPNICTIYDIGAAEDDRLFIAMAYYPRGTLAQRLAASPLPVSAATKIAIQIGDALECAHEAGIVHRDVKPANIAFGERGEVKVLDFGVAVLSDDAESAGIAGTPAYMAPEQLRGQAVDRRADVWALGVVLYEMLSGSKPFAGSDHHTVRQAIARDALPDLKAVRPDLPDNIVRIVNGALQRDPAERTPTAKAVADALRAAMAPPLVVQKRHPALRYAVMIGLFLAVGGVLQLRGPRLADGETAAIAVLPFTNITGQPQDEHFADGVTEDILTQLSRIPGLMVRSRTSVMRYKGTEHNVREIGELLEVPYVLEGSVRRAGDDVRIVAQLIDARTDRHVWAETYDRRLTDLFLVQSEIARDIARALGARVTGTQPDVTHAPDASAYEQFLLGRERFHTRTREALEEAIALFRNALTRDPDYALAHAFLASSYVRSIGPDYARVGQRFWLDSAEHHARRAITLAPQLPDGYAALGAAFNTAGKRADAIAQHERALAADPNYALAMYELSRTYRIDYHYDDAVLWIERAIAVDPARPDYRGYAATMYHALGMTDDARRHVLAGLRLNPADVTLHWEGMELELAVGDTIAAQQHLRDYIALRPSEQDRMMAWFEHERGNNAAAKPYIDRIVSGTTAWTDLYTYGLVYRAVGETARGDSLIRRARTIARAGVSSHATAGPGAEFVRAQAAAANGDIDQALDHLENWANAGAVRSWARVDRERVWSSLREQPRFRAVVATTQARLEQMRTRIRTQLAKASVGP